MKKQEEIELKKLFTELKTHKKSAFETFYEKYKKLVYGIAFSILKNKNDAEDMVQIVFAKLYEMDEEKFPCDKEATWLYTLTKNECISFLRKKKNEIDLESIYDIEDKNSEIDDIVHQDTYQRLICKLNEKEKEIVSLKILAGLSFEEIGHLLNEPTGTIKWRYYKSVHTLKILLSNLGMFMVTFAIGIKILFSTKKAENIMQESNEQENAVHEIEEVEETSNKLEEQNSQSWFDNIAEDAEESTTKPETVIPDHFLPEESINYWGIGMLSISTIFFILTTIFLISFIKHQLNKAKKASK